MFERSDCLFKIVSATRVDMLEYVGGLSGGIQKAGTDLFGLALLVYS